MIVLDASGLVDIALNRPNAPWVLDELMGHQIVAPAHQPAECLSAIARLVRSGTIAAATARAALDDFAGLDQELVVPTADHLRWALARQDRIRVLDGLYVALAADRRCSLVTTDHRLARAGADVDIRTPPRAP